MAAILHFGASVEELHSTEGMGNLRLGLDIIEEEMPVVDGEVQVPLGKGLGVHLNRDRLPNSVKVFDLKGQGKGRLWLYSHYARTFQRWNNVLYRARRRLGSANLFSAVRDLS